MMLAAASTAAALGVLLGAIGASTDSWLRLGLATLFAVLAVALGIVELLGNGVRLPQRNCETPQHWVQQGVLRWALRNGSALGSGFATRIGFGAWYAIPVACVLAGDVGVGALAYGAYGLSRGLGPWIFMAWGQMASTRGIRFQEVSACALGLRPFARRVSGGQLVLLGAASLLVLN